MDGKEVLIWFKKKKNPQGYKHCINLEESVSQ